MVRIKPWEDIHRAVLAIYGGSGQRDWLRAWDSAVPNAMGVLGDRLGSLSGESRRLAEEVLALVDRHKPDASDPLAKEHGTIGAAYRAMNDDERTDLKRLLWDLESLLDGEDSP